MALKTENLIHDTVLAIGRASFLGLFGLVEIFGATPTLALPLEEKVSPPAPRSVEFSSVDPRTHQLSRHQLKLTERYIDGIYFIYDGEMLDSPSATQWIGKTRGQILQARQAFARAKKAGLLTYCTPSAKTGTSYDPEPEQREWSLIFIPPGKIPALISVDTGAGFFYRENPGPILETISWNDDSIAQTILHEMTHAWCSSREENLSPRDRWLEEGVADWIAYSVTGKAPQQTLSRYFSAPCKSTYYGSSFLWVLSRFEKDSAAALAELHLGLRSADFHGGLALNEASCPSPVTTPRGQYLRSCPEGVRPSNCIPLWSTSWDELSVKQPPWRSAEQDRVFYWEE